MTAQHAERPHPRYAEAAFATFGALAWIVLSLWFLVGASFRHWDSPDPGTLYDAGVWGMFVLPFVGAGALVGLFFRPRIAGVVLGLAMALWLPSALVVMAS
jgi:hypothetical protein